MTFYRFKIKGKPCSVNSMYLQKGIHRVLSPEYRAFKNFVKSVIGEERLPEDVTAVAVHILYVVPDKRKRDIDNIIKPLLDGITQAGFWFDDSIVERLFVEKKIFKGVQGLIVEVAEIEKGKK